jgi:pyruvate dehydrogenase E1 component
LGLSENNLFMALGQFGLSHELFGETLLPVGTLYDTFIRRGLDAFFYGCYSGSKFVVVGTPSGITLSGEGGAHQSLGSQSIGTEMPGLRAYEPCFGRELEWIFMDALEKVRSRQCSTYLRLSTKAIDQDLFPASADAKAETWLREQVIRGAYRILNRSGDDGYEPGRNVVNLFAAGVLVPEAIAASNRLLQEGVLANVINVTGPGPLYQDFQSSRSRNPGGMSRTSHVEKLLAASESPAPAVTLIDDHPHTLAWIGGALGAPVYPMGVSAFGQSGDCRDLYREYGLDAESIVAVCRRALGKTGGEGGG